MIMIYMKSCPCCQSRTEGLAWISKTADHHTPWNVVKCWKFPQVRRSQANNFGGGLGTFCWFSFHFVYDLILKSRGPTAFLAEFQTLFGCMMMTFDCTSLYLKVVFGNGGLGRVLSAAGLNRAGTSSCVGLSCVNSLEPGRSGCNFRSVVSEHILLYIYCSHQVHEADQKNSLVSGPPTDPATTPPTVNFLQQSEQKVFFMAKKK